MTVRMLLIIVGMFCFAGIFSGCSKRERTLAGIALGAGTGLCIGSAVGNTEGAIAGSVMGAAVGGVLGNMSGNNDKEFPYENTQREYWKY